MNNINLIRNYTPETEINIILKNKATFHFKVSSLLKNFLDDSFIGFHLEDNTTRFINMQSIESINIINEQN